MVQEINDEQLEEVKSGFFDIDPEQVLEEARNEGLEVSSINDFREQRDRYEVIENVMNRYAKSYARYSAIGGATSGIGGVGTSIVLGGLEIVNTAIQLYRLSQRFAILNGFDPRQPLHKDKAQSVYLDTLGFKVATQAAIKVVLLRVSRSPNESSTEKSLFSNVVVRISRKVGSNISSSRMSKFIPVVGGAIGAYTSYSYAYDAGQSMGTAFKKHYFKEWHDMDPPAEEE